MKYRIKTEIKSCGDCNFMPQKQEGMGWVDMASRPHTTRMEAKQFIDFIMGQEIVKTTYEYLD